MHTSFSRRALLAAAAALTFGAALPAHAQETIKVGATAVPHAELLEHIKPALKAAGVELQIVEFSDYVHRGMSLRDAYYLTHRQQLEQRAAEAGRRQALSEVRSKEHLSALGPVRGGGAAAVPPEELRWFRALNPEAKDADIQDYYNRARRGK